MFSFNAKSLFILVCAVTFQACCSSGTDADGEVFHELKGKLAEVEFRTRRTELTKATTPQHRQLAIYVNGKLERTVNSILDIQGFVTIKRPADALMVVRLLSDQRTIDLRFREWLGWEILSDGDLLGREGTLPLDFMKQINVTSASVGLLNDGGWRIERYILSQFVVDFRIERVVETVEADGLYSLIEKVEVFSGKVPNIQLKIEL